MTFDNPSFTTSARSRGGKLLTFDLHHAEVDVETGNVTELDLVFRIDPKLDVIRFGAVVGGFSAALVQMDNADVETEEKLQRLDRETPRVRSALRECLVPHDRPLWDKVSEGVDIRTLGDILRWLSRELSGKNPTQPTSSSDGSTSTGNASTGGALPAPSISDASPSPVP